MITTKIETIDARRARLYLASAVPNRPIVASTVRRYARDMAAGHWRLTGQPIIFDSEASLVDGRHRLTAIASTDTRATILVVRGVDPDTIHSIDTGRARSAGQVLGLLGVSNANRTASIARTFYFLDRGGGNLMDSVSVDEITETMRRHPGIGWIVGQPTATSSGVLTVAPVLAAFGLMYERHPAEAAAYWSAFHTGANLGSGDPLLTLRNVLLSPTARADQLTRSRYGRFTLARATLGLLRARLLGKHMARMPGANEPGTLAAVEYFTGAPAGPLTGEAAVEGAGA